MGTSTIDRLARDAQHRGGLDTRRADGAFFTDHDVALHLATRAIGARLLDHAGLPGDDVDQLLASGADMVDELVERCADQAVRARVVEQLGALRILDPTCGAGSFLHAAWLVLVRIDAALEAGCVHAGQLRGVDVSTDAVDACRETLRIVTGGSLASLAIGDAEAAATLPAADVVLGNPPFVRATADARHGDLATRGVPNRSAWIVERALDVAAPSARIAFVLPISTSCTDAFAAARGRWDEACSTVLTSHFDTIPSSLFDGVVQRLSIYEGRRRTDDDLRRASWYTTRYHRWLRDERDALLGSIRHVAMPTQSVGGSIAKVGSGVERELLDTIFRHPPAGRWHAAKDQGGDGTNRFRYKRRWSYFLLFCDFVPELWDADGALREPTELKAIDVVPDVDARVLLAAYSSSLFWWYFSVFTDNRNVNRRDLAAFPMPELEPADHDQLASLGGELMDALRACAEVRTCTYRSIGTIRNTYFRQAATRPVLDRIDEALARAYGMDERQLAFVLGFERRFRR